MADIFLSYARADRARIEKLASALEEAGYSVWWDRHLAGGHDFSADIERELNAAKAVIVAWSADGGASHWVRDEAGAGRDQGKLVPIRLDATSPPMGFRQLHTIDLSMDPPSPHEMTSLTKALDALVGENHAPLATVSGNNSWRRWAIIAASLTLAIGVTAYFVSTPGPNLIQKEDIASERTKSLAILPFKVLGEGDQDYLGHGLSSALTADLSAFPALRIIAGTSASAMADRSLTAIDIGNKFSIGSIIEGEVRKTGERLVLSARLVDTSTAQIAWSGEVEGPAVEIQDLQRKLMLDLASALQTRLGLAAPQLERGRTIDQTAYDAYLQGLDAINRRAFFDTADKYRRDGYRALTRAIEIAPDFADAWAARAYLGSFSNAEVIGVDQGQRSERVASDIAKALELDPVNRLAMSAQVRWLVDNTGELEKAIEISDQLLSHDPNFHPAIYSRAVAHLVGGDNEEALNWAERLVASDPFNEAQLGILMIAWLRQGDYDSFVRFLADCDLCERKGTFEAFALTAVATPDEISKNRDRVVAGMREEAPPEFTKAYTEVIDAMAGGPAPSQKSINWLLAFHMPEIALASRFGAEDQAFVRAQEYVDDAERGPTELNFIMVDQRISFTPELRADPRYHALFNSRHAQNLLAYRRKKGNLGGLPLEPDEVEAERRRLARLGQ